jgi:cytochrome c oxidase cbb3-type subunit 3
MAEKKRIDDPTGTETVGHEWDGIEELNSPLPRWWLWTFYATIVWAIAYTIAYPAWPMLENATAGVLGWSSRSELQNEMASADARLKPVREALAATSIEALPDQPELLQAAVAGGASAFKVYCVQCHGSGAAGSKGYPNLNDDDWLWGGDIAAIHTTLVNGIRQPGNDQTRMSAMPAFGRDGLLEAGQIDAVVAHVRVISGQQTASATSTQGAGLFLAQCAVCHGADGKGDRTQGAPNLTDRIWLYGGDAASLKQTITNSRAGVMPAWGGRLDDTTVKMLAAYVHSLGGGEELAERTAVVPSAESLSDVAP